MQHLPFCMQQDDNIGDCRYLLHHGLSHEVIEDGRLLRQDCELVMWPAGQAVLCHFHLSRVEPQVCAHAESPLMTVNHID